MMTNFPDPAGQNKPTFDLFNTSGLSLPVTETQVKKLVQEVQSGEEISFLALEIVFVDEDEIVKINKQYLDRSYVTDIITFRYDEPENNQQIEGTLYCCAPRIAEQSEELETDAETEFLRIVAHGLIHLAGYDDQSPQEKSTMTSLENLYLSKINHGA